MQIIEDIHDREPMPFDLRATSEVDDSGPFPIIGIANFGWFDGGWCLFHRSPQLDEYSVFSGIIPRKPPPPASQISHTRVDTVNAKSHGHHTPRTKSMKAVFSLTVAALTAVLLFAPGTAEAR